MPQLRLLDLLLNPHERDVWTVDLRRCLEDEKKNPFKGTMPVRK